jgi:hypothetical protein
MRPFLKTRDKPALPAILNNCCRQAVAAGDIRHFYGFFAVHTAIPIANLDIYMPFLLSGID